ncbi:MAG: PDZ domain-containing protein [Bacteroidetes bacterium]|nr:PDZ domain-containing protein [Bacteroidota bacterium]
MVKQRISVITFYLIVLLTIASFAQDFSRFSWLGVLVRDSVPISSHEPSGVVIVRIVKNGPAANAGLRVGDIIFRFNDVKINTSQDLLQAVQKTKPNENVTIAYRREGREKAVTVQLAEVPKRVEKKIVHRYPEFNGACVGGAKVRTLTEQLAEYFGAPENEGVLVEEVISGSSASKAGLKAGDVLLRIGKKRIDEVQDLWRILSKYHKNDTVEVEIVRNKSIMKLSWNLENCCHLKKGTMGPGRCCRGRCEMFIRPFDFNKNFYNLESEKCWKLPFDDRDLEEEL